MEEAKKYVESLLAGQEGLKQLQENAFGLAREIFRSSRLEIARMEAATQDQLQEAQHTVQWLSQEASQYENMFFDRLKSGVVYAAAHRNEAVAAASILLVLSLPATRRALYSRTVGRFQTPEGLVLSAEKRLDNLKQSTEVLKNDASKLQERAILAEEEYKSGLSKMRATAAEIRRVSSVVRSAESSALGLKELLKELPARDSVRLRAQLAETSYELRQQHLALDRKALKISRFGVGA